MNVIVKMIFGSHLYGTHGPDSDRDFKGVFLPTRESLILGQRTRSITDNTKKGEGKNASSDVDVEFYSLHYFLKLALEGQTVALDMLHAPQTAIIESSHLWDVLVEQRSRFYTKNLKAFIGYARKQAAKYGIKGSRLSDVRAVVKFLDRTIHLAEHKDPIKLRDVWDQLPKGEHIKFHVEPTVNKLRLYQVAGKNFQETARLDYVQPILERFFQEYGERAKLAELNEGVDWKALSHALRAAYQVQELLRDGTMTLPSPYRSLLLAIKRGKVNFASVQEELEHIMDSVEKLAERSSLPEKADYNFAKHFILQAYGLTGELDVY